MAVDNRVFVNAKIMIVDDSPANLKLLRQGLEAVGCRVLIATSGERTLDIVGEGQPELILLDVVMGGIDGYETCRQLKMRDDVKDIPVIFLTAQNDPASVVTGFEVGGVDYVIKPFQTEEVLARVQTHLENTRLTRALADKNRELEEKNRALEAAIDRGDQLTDQLSMISQREAEHWGIVGAVGEGQMLQQMLEDVSRLQHSGKTSVLITGESGTGKELIARAIHLESPRASAAFVPVNCSAIPADLAESLLFGHMKGAFTGADDSRKGYFELAQGGTLFLDEIGDMPLDLQAKLLRVLDDGVVTPIGAPEGKQVDVRVLAATNVDVQARVSEGTFRQDLYYRLAGYLIQTPPLRERIGDIEILANHFLNLFAQEMGFQTPHLRPEAMAMLKAYAFPGNVRELKNVIERALIQSGGRNIEAEHIHFFSSEAGRDSEEPTSDSGTTVTLPLPLAEAERVLIRETLALTNDNIAAAARLLGVHRPRIYRFLKEEGHTEG